MSVFQLLLLAGAAYFAWQIYRHVRTLEDGKPTLPSQNSTPANTANRVKPRNISSTLSDALEKADKAHQEGDFFNAKIYLERAEKKDPDNIEILNKLGFILHKLGEDEDALRSYRRSLSIYADDDITHNAIASVLRSLGRLDEAQEHYKSAVDINEHNPLTYFNYAELLLEKSDLDGAKMMFEHALELDPDYENAKEALEKIS